ncbi:hypothetical protein BJY24_001762 [Nocardia transvalensis]|uniref:Outer membrane channel protein CpnT-like N-terminal domain-containing protein n=1 Tax=Nocardia transvalensis TaxID=37333 RepID=A0A7W9PBG0_9NOCA|nr:hypothetical protein [Nocardia transvalensis]MBB5912895.1 hypothetical protein [Nocardia transvalensis]
MAIWKPPLADSLGFLVGMKWPDGNEDLMWGLSDDWRNAAASLKDINQDIDDAIAAIRTAYPEGAGGEAMIKQLQAMRTGDGSVDKLVEWFNTVADTANDTANQIEYTKIMFDCTLTLMAVEMAIAAWSLFAAPAEEALIIAANRVTVRILMRRLMTALTEQGLKNAALAALKSPFAKRLLMHMAFGGGLNGAMDAGIQGYQNLFGRSDKFNVGQTLTTGLSGAAGALTGMGVGKAALRPMSKLFGKETVGQRWLVDRTAGMIGGGANAAGAWLTNGAMTNNWHFDPRMATSAMAGGLMHGTGIPKSHPGATPKSLAGPHIDPRTTHTDVPHSDGSTVHAPSTTGHETAPHGTVDHTGNGHEGSPPATHPAAAHSPTEHAPTGTETPHGGTNGPAGPEVSPGERPVHDGGESPIQAGPSERPAHDQPVHDQPVHEQPAHDQPVHEQPAHDQPVHEQPAHDQPVHDQPVHDQPVRDHPAREHPLHEQPVRDQPVHDQPVRDQPVREQPTHDQPVHERPSGPAETRPTIDAEHRSPDLEMAVARGDSPAVAGDHIGTTGHDAEAPPAHPSDRPGETAPGTGVSGVEPRSATNTTAPRADSPTTARPADTVGSGRQSASPVRNGETSSPTRPGDNTSPARPGDGTAARPGDGTSSARPSDTAGSGRSGDTAGAGRPGETPGSARSGERPRAGLPAAGEHGRPESPIHARSDGTEVTPRAHEAEPVRAGEERPGEHPPAKDHDTDPATEHEVPPKDPHETGPVEPRPSIEEAHARHGEETPAGVSHHRGDATMGDLPHRVPHDERYFSADVHVTKDGHANIGGHKYTPEEYGNLLRDHGWDGKKPIRLIGCDAAANGFAHRLATHLGTDVLAPTKSAWSDGKGRVYSSTPEIGPDGNRRPRIPPDGEWETHRPDGTRVKASEDGFVPGTKDSDKHIADPDSAKSRGQEERDALVPETDYEKKVVKGDVTYYLDENDATKKVVGELDPPSNYTKRGVNGRPHPEGFIHGVDHRGHILPEAGFKDHHDVNVDENIFAQQGNANLSPKKVWENAGIAYGKTHPGTIMLGEVLSKDANNRPIQTKYMVYDSDGNEIPAFTVIIDNPDVKGQKASTIPANPIYPTP